MGQIRGMSNVDNIRWLVRCWLVGWFVRSLLAVALRRCGGVAALRRSVLCWRIRKCADGSLKGRRTTADGDG